jgi:iron complex transport system ATP-binding protein
MIEINNVSYCLKNNKQILKDISFKINKGKTLGILGENGAGKTTLLNLIAGIYSPNNGNILLEGNNLSNLKIIDKAKKITLCTPQLFPEFRYKVKDIVSAGRFPYIKGLGILRYEDKKIIETVLNFMELKPLENVLFNEISTGEQQRVLLAKSFVQEPEYLLLDEPFEHLDVRHQSLYKDLLQKKAKKDGIGLVIVSHNIDAVINLSDSLLFLKDGNLLAFGDKEDVMSASIFEKTFQTKFALSFSDNKWKTEFGLNN